MTLGIEITHLEGLGLHLVESGHTLNFFDHGADSLSVLHLTVAMVMIPLFRLLIRSLKMAKHLA
jgi:hypothetical protein